MKYKIKKSTVIKNLIFIAIISAALFCITFLLYTKDRSNPGVLAPPIVAFLLFFPAALLDLRSFVLIEEGCLTYFRYNRKVSINFSGICRIEHKSLLWKKGFAVMMIYPGSIDRPLSIDSSFENYEKLCKEILAAYSPTREDACIDPKLYELLK